MGEVFDRPLVDAYWRFMDLRAAYAARDTPALDWWMADGAEPLSPAESRIFEFVAGADHILDVGAGDGRVERRFREAGHTQPYSTVDRSGEFEPDYRSIEDAPAATFDAVLALEVIEHMPLEQFDEFVDGLLRVLTPDGRLVISTPNAAFVGSIHEGDMTHVHAYRLQDLAAYLQLRGFTCEIFRLNWRPLRLSIKERVRRLFAKVVIRGILQLDYARGVAVLAQRTGA